MGGSDKLITSDFDVIESPINLSENSFIISNGELFVSFDGNTSRFLDDTERNSIQYGSVNPIALNSSEVLDMTTNSGCINGNTVCIIGSSELPMNNTSVVFDITNPSVKSYSSDLPNTVKWLSVCYGNNKYVALGYNMVYGEDRIFTATSIDGISWDVIHFNKPAFDGEILKVIFGNNKFVITYENPNLISSDGITWEDTLFSGTKDVVFCDPYFVGVTSSELIISSDGIAYISKPLPLEKRGHLFVNGNILLLTSIYYNTCMVSFDYGDTWIDLPSSVSESNIFPFAGLSKSKFWTQFINTYES